MSIGVGKYFASVTKIRFSYKHKLCFKNEDV